MSDDVPKATKVLQVMAEVHALTRLPRTGWIMAGVRDPESVSDHCYEAAMFAVFLATQAEMDVDVGRVISNVTVSRACRVSIDRFTSQIRTVH